MNNSHKKSAGLWVWALGLLALLSVVNAQAKAPATPTSPPDPPSKIRLIESYGKLPLSFELNQGQTDKEVKFLSRGPGYSLFLTPTEAVLTLAKPEPKAQVGSSNTPSVRPMSLIAFAASGLGIP